MGNSKYLYYWMAMCMLLTISCNKQKTSPITPDLTSPICILENNQHNYHLRPFVQVLEDSLGQYTIQEIVKPDLQAQFEAFPRRSFKAQNQRYYWGKIQIENRLPNAHKQLEWVLSFSTSWTDMDIYLQNENGEWEQQPNGIFTPDFEKDFVPTTKGNLLKIALPSNETVTIYFRGIGERAATVPAFYVFLKHIENYYEDLMKTRTNEAIYLGFLLMMFLYNLILYFFGRDRSFIFYSGYLIMMVIYSGYSSGELADWLGVDLFPHHPQYWMVMKWSIYFGLMSYLAFIRSFLDLKELLPKWGLFFKRVIYLGFPLIAIDAIILYFSNFSSVVQDIVSIFYISLVMLTCCSLIYPLYKTRDKKGYFVIAGITAISVGSVLTIFSRIVVTDFSIFYLQAGTIVEIVIFSLGLAYRQRKQKQAQQQADFELKKSQLIQEKRQIEADRLKELSDFKARFYTNITHEFRTPLTVIMGMSDNLKNNPNEQQLIKRNSENLLRLINQLLDLSKLESGNLPLNQVHQDIIIYLQYLTESFYSAAMQKDIRLVFHSEEKAVWMDYDEEKIQQIVYNLLSNALKFTPKVGKIIFHASKIEVEGQPFLKLKIKDTGIGIPAKNIHAIFDRFHQINQPNQNPQEGTGIGLALTKELVELMNGRIEVESEIGKGTEFIVYLPIEKKALQSEKAFQIKNNPAQKWKSDGGTTEQKNNGEKQAESPTESTFPELLIIEDNPDIIVYIQSILQNSYQIHTAKNGALGIEKAIEIVPDIVISDIMMPEKDGYEVCQTLKQDERTSHIPIILLTAKSTQADKIDGLKIGADVYLNKPFDKEELLIQIKNLIAIRQQLQRHYANQPALANGQTTPIAAPSIEDIFLQKLCTHIQNHLDDTEFGVPQLAAAVPISQMQLYRKLKALTGKTPSQFIRSYRLQKALALLKTGNLNVSEIAYAVGFADPSYFSRMFQKEFGHNPSHFLNS